MNKKVAIILVNYKDYAKKYLADCLSGIREQNYPGDKKLFIVDNSSTEETYNFLRKNSPEAEIIANKDNDGFAKGNNDAIKVALAEDFEYVVLFNMDTIIDPLAVSEMVNVVEENEGIGAVQARIMLHPEKDLINSLGNSTHFLGFGFCLNYRDKWSLNDFENKKKFFKNKKNPAHIFYPSGAGVLFKASVLKEVGLFDESYFMYNEDQDLGWRIWLRGYSCVLAERAVVYHKYEFARSVKKYYFMDRNRLITVFKNYKVATLILFFPAGVIMEIGLVLFAVLNGGLRQKIRVWLYFLWPPNIYSIIKSRSNIQKNRKIRDSELIDLMSGKIWYQEIGSKPLRLANFFLNIYFFIFKRIVKFFNI